MIKTDKTFTKHKLILNRIVLEGGRQVDPKAAAEVSGKQVSIRLQQDYHRD